IALTPPPPSSPLFPYTTLFRSGLKRVAVLMNATNPGNIGSYEAMAKMARTVHVDVVQVLAKSVEDFDTAFAQMTKARPDGLAVRSEEHTSELQSMPNTACRLLL